MNFVVVVSAMSGKKGSGPLKVTREFVLKAHNLCRFISYKIRVINSVQFNELLLM